MQLEQGRLSSSQLTVLALGFLIGSSVILSPGADAKNNAWLAIAAGMLAALIFVLIFTALTNHYPGKTIVEINDIILGSYLGKVFSILYMLYFFHLGALVLRNSGDFFATIMRNTPLIVFLIMLALVCAVAVRSGIEVIARTSIVLVPLHPVALILDTVLITEDIDLSNLLPFMDIPFQDFIKAAHNATSFPFGELIVFVMLLALINNSNKGRRSLLWALLIGGIFYITSAIRNIAILGNTAAIDFLPTFSAIRLINLADVLTRLEIIISINLLTAHFMYISVVYYAVVLGTAQILKMRSYKPLVFPIGALLVSFSLLQYNTAPDNTYFTQVIYPYYSLPFELILPLFTLIAAKIRKFPQESERLINNPGSDSRG